MRARTHNAPAVWRLGGDTPRPVLQLDPDLPLAIGSTFKLYILGALIDAAAAGEARWEQTLRVRDSRAARSRA